MSKLNLVHQITNFFSVNNKKEKANDDITDNKDSNKCISVILSVTTVQKMRNGFTNVLQFDTQVDLSVNTDWMLKINI
jgi:hypothetical protein